LAGASRQFWKCVFDYGTAGADYFLFEVLEVQP